MTIGTDESVEILIDALERIMKKGVGVGPDWSDEECIDYWSSIVFGTRETARLALAEYGKAMSRARTASSTREGL